MENQIKFIFVDQNASMVEAWRREFGNYSPEEVEILQGDIWQKPASAIVSPANSFGFMDGGIDAVYTRRFGPKLQVTLQDKLAKYYDGELPVGQGVFVRTGDPSYPYLISAPTMRVPGDVSMTPNAFLSLKAAIKVALTINEIYHLRESKRREGDLPLKPDRITSILCPGLGTGVGGMPFERCAAQMHKAYRLSYKKDIKRFASLADAAFDDFCLRPR